MKKYLTMFGLACCLGFLAGCDDDDHALPQGINSEIVTAFSARYPEAWDVEWKLVKDYAVAEFDLGRRNSLESEAWFDNRSGLWIMTVTDRPFDALPEAVRNSFRTGDHAAWAVDEVEMIEREGMETVYVIGVEKGEAEVDLFYSPDGVLIRTTVEEPGGRDDSSLIPSVEVSKVKAFVAERYPQARILEIDREGSRTEVDILDGGTYRELLFDAEGAWLQTKTEVRSGDVPAVVMRALAASEYASLRIDDIDHYQTSSGEFYRFELDSVSGDVKIDINLEGKVSPAR